MADTMRNLNPKCAKCEDNKQSLTKCMNECGIPWDILHAMEEERNEKVKGSVCNK